MLLGITISFPITYIYEPSYVLAGTGDIDNTKLVGYTLFFPFIFTLVSISIIIGIQQKCFVSGNFKILKK